jgi:ribosomal protein S18 acetylase RimI-like enzyme
MNDRTSPMLTVRAGTTAELQTFADFWLAMFEEAEILRDDDMVPDWRSRFCGYLARRMDDGEAAFFVALDGATIVGTAGAILTDGYPYFIHGIKRGYIFGVRVAPSHRRRGIARDLTEAAIGFLRESGCEKIRLHASPFGRRIYERLGFRATNEMELGSPEE